MKERSDHFEGKNVYQHLKEAREKGAKVSQEPHGIEPSGYVTAVLDSLKETAVIYLALFVLLSLLQPPSPLLFLALFSGTWIIWKGGRSALLGWAKLEQLHRLIEEERWEIEHHRRQEKEELRAMYEQKGFSGELLDHVVEVLIADDNRLLRVMLEEELGLTLESFEHPLKQALGACLGACLGALVALLTALTQITPLILASQLLLFGVATWFEARQLGNKRAKALIWHLAVALLALGTSYFLSQVRT